MKIQVENKIQKLLEQDFTEPVTSLPWWVSPLVCVLKKNRFVCLCAEISQTNTAIVRNHHPILKLDQILFKVNCAEIVSNLELAEGYKHFDKSF